MSEMCDKKTWLELIGSPENYGFVHSCKLLKTYEYNDMFVELYEQNNGPGTTQRVMKAVPRNISGKLPAVAVPFYYPEAMLGFDPETNEELPRFVEVSMMKDMARRGFIAASADAYYITYPHKREISGGWNNWVEVGDCIQKEQPGWSGVGKLFADTQLLIDMLSDDPRVDADRIGITGHSLGGKMAFYAGTLDDRIKAVMVSDFGFGWDQTNWSDTWYWGGKLEQLKARGIDHTSLLGCANGKPFCLLAGEADDMTSWEMMKAAPGYTPADYDKKLKIINHATGHRPPQDVLHAGYDFLEHFLKDS